MHDRWQLRYSLITLSVSMKKMLVSPGSILTGELRKPRYEEGV